MNEILRKEIESINELSDQKRVRDLRERLLYIDLNGEGNLELIKLAEDRGII